MWHFIYCVWTLWTFSKKKFESFNGLKPTILNNINFGVLTSWIFLIKIWAWPIDLKQFNLSLNFLSHLFIWTQLRKF